MSCKIKTIMIDGEEYVRKSDMSLADHVYGLRYCIVRCHDAGVHAGYVAEHEGRQVKLLKSRRLWRWYGKTLSGLAIEGTFAPEKCKFANEIPEITVLDACEIIPCTQVAIDSLRGVRDWENE